jgi:hypothetical protein
MLTERISDAIEQGTSLDEIILCVEIDTSIN